MSSRTAVLIFVLFAGSAFGGVTHAYSADKQFVPCAVHLRGWSFVPGSGHRPQFVVEMSADDGHIVCGGAVQNSFYVKAGPWAATVTDASTALSDLSIKQFKKAYTLALTALATGKKLHVSWFCDGIYPVVPIDSCPSAYGACPYWLTILK